MDQAVSTSRQPRFQYLVGGKLIAGAEEVEVQTNSYRRANTFRAKIAFYAGSGTYTAATARDASNRPLLAEIRASLDGGAGWTSLLIGRADRFSLDPVRGVLEINGRDRTADLIEGKTQDAFRNQTASEVAMTVAGRLGLDAVISPTKTPVGRFYDIDHDRVTLGQFSTATTYWDLLCRLARDEGFDVWVEGNTLFFQPTPTGMETPGLTFTLQQTQGYRSWTNAESVVLERDLVLARDIEVQVHSFNSRQKKGFTVSYRSPGGKSGSAGAALPSKGPATQVYPVVQPNLTQDQALQLAQRLARDLTLQERRATVRMPGELVLTPRSIVGVAGTGTDFDQAYFVGEISRRLTASGGFSQTLQLKNQSPRATSIVSGT